MPNNPQIVVAFDFSPSSEHALLRAVEVVARAPQHVLHVVTVLDTRGHFVTGSTKLSYQSADDVQRHVTERITAAFAGRPNASEVDAYVHARIGKPVETILQLAAEVGADLIFIGSHGLTGVERVLLGSVSERVVREAKCPVMVVRTRTYPPVERLQVFAYDHERKPFHPPHRYKYVDPRVIKRPDEWPI